MISSPKSPTAAQKPSWILCRRQSFRCASSQAGPETDSETNFQVHRCAGWVGGLVTRREEIQRGPRRRPRSPTDLRIHTRVHLRVCLREQMSFWSGSAAQDPTGEFGQIVPSEQFSRYRRAMIENYIPIKSVGFAAFGKHLLAAVR